MLGVILEYLNNVCRALGAKGVKRIRRQTSRLKYPDEKKPTVEEVIAQLGGKGVIIEKGKKDV